jgi:kynurenine 3-monooxygenase
MRHAVTTPSYLFRKAVDNVLEALTSSAPSSHAPKVIDSPGPSADLTYTAPAGEDPEPAFMAEPFGWLPLYSMVTFRPRMGYASARRKAQAQMRVLKTIEGAVLFGTATALIWAGWSARRRWL